MNFSTLRSFFGVLLGFGGIFFLFAKREKETSPDDAETLLMLAQNQMREAQARNRVRAVSAITQKNNLQAHFDQTQKIVDNLQAKAQTAHDEGNFDLKSVYKKASAPPPPIMGEQEKPILEASGSPIIGG